MFGTTVSSEKVSTICMQESLFSGRRSSRTVTLYELVVLIESGSRCSSINVVERQCPCISDQTGDIWWRLCACICDQTGDIWWRLCACICDRVIIFLDRRNSVGPPLHQST